MKLSYIMEVIASLAVSTMVFNPFPQQSLVSTFPTLGIFRSFNNSPIENLEPSVASPLCTNAVVESPNKISCYTKVARRNGTEDFTNLRVGAKDMISVSCDGSLNEIEDRLLASTKHFNSFSGIFECSGNCSKTKLDQFPLQHFESSYALTRS